MTYNEQHFYTLTFLIQVELQLVIKALLENGELTVAYILKQY